MRNKTTLIRVSSELEREFKKQQDIALNMGIDVSVVELSRRAATKLRRTKLI